MTFPIATSTASVHTMINAGSALNAAQASDATTADVGAGLDLSSSDTVLAFFSAQMSESQDNLNAMMAQQQQRNDTQKAVQNLAAQLTEYEQTGVKPGDKGWDDFVATANELKKYTTDGSDASKKINAMLDTATTQGAPTHATLVLDQTAIADAKSHGLKVDGNTGGDGLFGMIPPNAANVWYPTGAPGITADQMKSLDMQLKSVTDGMTSDTSMQMIRVQQAVEQSSQILNECSNVVKKMSDANDNAIANIK